MDTTKTEVSVLKFPTNAANSTTPPIPAKPAIKVSTSTGTMFVKKPTSCAKPVTKEETACLATETTG